jgi:hypothetical protein
LTKINSKMQYMKHIVEKECRILCDGERKRIRILYVHDCFRQKWVKLLSQVILAMVVFVAV